MTTFLDVLALEKYAAGVCGRAGLSVTWDKADSTPRTDGRTIWLPTQTSDSSPETLLSLRYYIKHEVSHCVDSDFDYLNEKRPLGALGLINNLFEDNRIDYRNDTTYAGDVVTSNAYWELYAKKIATAKGEDLTQKRSVIAAFMLDALARNWFTTAHLALIELQKQATADNMRQLEEVLRQGCLDDLLALRSINTRREAAEAVMALARTVFSILFPESNVDEQYESPAKGSKKGDKGEKCEGEGEGSGGTEKCAGEGSGADDTDRIVNVDRVTAPVAHEHAATRTGVHMEHKLTRGTYIIPTPSEYRVKNFPLVGEYKRAGYFDVNRVTNNIEANGKPMANKLRVQLQTRSRGRYEYGQKRGKLHNGSLHRVLQGDSKQAEKVFRTHKVTDTLDTAVTLLVDCSGSMDGRKFEMACSAAGALVEALRPLHIPYNVLGFTNDTFHNEEPLIFNFAKFGETVTTPELVSRFKQASGCLWDNSDGDAIVYAYHHLLQRKEKRKVLLVMSDGSPSGRHAAGDVVSYTKQVTTTIYNSKLVDMYGIGIMDSNVEMYYDKHVVVNKIEELSGQLLSIVDRSFV